MRVWNSYFPYKSRTKLMNKMNVLEKKWSCITKMTFPI